MIQDLAGQPRAQRLLAGALAHLSHAYLFVGPDQGGKRLAARLFAAAINCLDADHPGCGHCRECRQVMEDTHPDVRLWELGEGEKTFKVERVRELIHAVAWHPYQGRRKVHVLVDLDAVNPAGANALLKTLEEPPSATTLILIARDLDTVLPTLVSRCQVVPFGLTPVEAIAEHLQLRLGLSPEAAREVAFRSQGRMGAAIALTAGPLPAVSGARFPEPGEAMSWADNMAGMPEPEQTAALEALLAELRDMAMLAAGEPAERLRHPASAERLFPVATSAPIDAWVAKARMVEEARERLRGHGNAKLVFDKLARALA